MQTILKTGILKKKFDRKTTQQKDYIVSVLKEHHLDLIMGLQAIIFQKLHDSSLMEPIPLEFMKEHIERQGFILGVFVDLRLMAYRIVYFPHSRDKVFNMGFDIGLTEYQRSKVANLQMVCVHPRFRGNGLALTLNRLALRLLRRQHNFEHIFATVSPYNVWNIRILLNSGFSITSIKFKYGDKLRYVVYQNLHAPVEFIDGPAVYTDLDDLITQKKLFKSGFYGVTMVQNHHVDSGFKKTLTLYHHILFKKPSDKKLIHVVERDLKASDSTKEITFPLWYPEFPHDGQGNIACYQSVSTGRAHPLDRLTLTDVPIEL